MLFAVEKSYLFFSLFFLISSLEKSRGRVREKWRVKSEKRRVKSTKRKSRLRDFSFWPTRKDSNLRPSESESDALSSCATGRYSFHTLLLYHKPFKIATPFPKKVIVKFRVFPPGLAKWPKSLFLSAYMKHIFTIFRWIKAKTEKNTWQINIFRV